MILRRQLQQRQEAARGQQRRLQRLPGGRVARRAEAVAERYGQRGMPLTSGFGSPSDASSWMLAYAACRVAVKGPACIQNIMAAERH